MEVNFKVNSPLFHMFNRIRIIFTAIQNITSNGFPHYWKHESSEFVSPIRLIVHFFN